MGLGRSQQVLASQRLSVGLDGSWWVYMDPSRFWHLNKSQLGRSQWVLAGPSRSPWISVGLGGSRQVLASQRVSAGVGGSRWVLVGLGGSRRARLDFAGSLWFLLGLGISKDFSGSWWMPASLGSTWRVWVSSSQGVSAGLSRFGESQQVLTGHGGFGRSQWVSASERVTAGLGGSRRVLAGLCGSRPVETCLVRSRLLSRSWWG